MKEKAKAAIPVIINADDFGYSQKTNTCIFTAAQKRCISSATIMANGPALRDALALLPGLPQLSFGVHLNLTEFSPVLPTAELKAAGLVDADGTFLGNAFRQLRPSPRLLEACYQELKQQLLSLYEKGLRPSHLDSHHHIHTIPWLLPVIWKLQQKYKIYRLRNTLNVYQLPSAEASRLKLLAAKRLWQVASVLLGSKMTQRFSSVQIFLANPYRSEFSRASSIELMCHPGQAGFEAETQQLLRGGETVLPEGFRLVNYPEMLSA
ncbi:MAG: ChbG/HpnK family deacetylase [Cyanobacteriota bacterium]|jgi:predicted glycoside hydrolase/deacetylase ChbG (UPF0249 family)